MPPHFLVGYASETNCTCQLLEPLLLVTASFVVKAATKLEEGAGTDVEISEASPRHWFDTIEKTVTEMLLT